MTRHVYLTHECLQCSKPLVPKEWHGKRRYSESRVRFNARKFCDNACRSENLRITGKGARNYFFGKHLVPHNKRAEDYWENIDVNGYVRVYLRTATGAIEKFKHRHVMAQLLGRPLRSDEQVHHIDGDKLNNAPENLMVLSPSQHAKLHHAERCNTL